MNRFAWLLLLVFGVSLVGCTTYPPLVTELGTGELPYRTSMPMDISNRVEKLFPIGSSAKGLAERLIDEGFDVKVEDMSGKPETNYPQTEIYGQYVFHKG